MYQSDGNIIVYLTPHEKWHKTVVKSKLKVTPILRVFVLQQSLPKAEYVVRFEKIKKVNETLT